MSSNNVDFHRRLIAIAAVQTDLIDSWPDLHNVLFQNKQFLSALMQLRHLDIVGFEKQFPEMIADMSSLDRAFQTLKTLDQSELKKSIQNLVAAIQNVLDSLQGIKGLQEDDPSETLKTA